MRVGVGNWTRFGPGCGRRRTRRGHSGGTFTQKSYRLIAFGKQESGVGQTLPDPEQQAPCTQGGETGGQKCCQRQAATEQIRGMYASDAPAQPQAPGCSSGQQDDAELLGSPHAPAVLCRQRDGEGGDQAAGLKVDVGFGRGLHHAGRCFRIPSWRSRCLFWLIPAAGDGRAVTLSEGECATPGADPTDRVPVRLDAVLAP